MTIKANIIDNKVLEEENQAENPVLFVRINSAGTTLSGDDLIYSIYKAIFPEAKDLIENIGLKFIAPTQVLSLVSRIVASDLSNHTFPRKMNVRDFQNRIKNNDFKENLKLLIETDILQNCLSKRLIYYLVRRMICLKEKFRLLSLNKS